MAESKEELESLLMRLKEGSKKAGLRINFKKANENHDIWFQLFMANRRGEGRSVTDLVFLGSKITVHGDCSHEIKNLLFLGRKL